MNLLQSNVGKLENFNYNELYAMRTVLHHMCLQGHNERAQRQIPGADSTRTAPYAGDPSSRRGREFESLHQCQAQVSIPSNLILTQLNRGEYNISTPTEG